MNNNENIITVDFQQSQEIRSLKHNLERLAKTAFKIWNGYPVNVNVSLLNKTYTQFLAFIDNGGAYEELDTTDLDITCLFYRLHQEHARRKDVTPSTKFCERLNNLEAHLRFLEPVQKQDMELQPWERNLPFTPLVAKKKPA